MNYWHVYFDKTESKYKLHASNNIAFENDSLVVFKVFDMAYDYVMRLNGSKTQAYSRWMVRA